MELLLENQVLCFHPAPSWAKYMMVFEYLDPCSHMEELKGFQASVFSLAQPGSLPPFIPKWPQWPELCQSKARSFLQVSHTSAGSQGFGSSSSAFPGHKQGAGWEVGLQELEPAPIWDLGVCEVRTLAARPPRRAPLVASNVNRCTD